MHEHEFQQSPEHWHNEADGCPYQSMYVDWQGDLGLIRLTMRLSDAGLRQRPTKLIYPNHRSSPWVTEDATPRSLEPIVRGRLEKRTTTSRTARPIDKN
jgi:hypothetical protein